MPKHALMLVLISSLFTATQDKQPHTDEARQPVSTMTAKSPECPVTFELVEPRYINSRRAGGIYDFYFKTKWKNVTTKEIIGAKFRAAFYDQTRDRHEIYENWSTDQKVKPGETKGSMWQDEYWIRSYGHPDAEIWPVKVLFADGTIWQDDGSRACLADNKTAKGSWWVR